MERKEMFEVVGNRHFLIHGKWKNRERLWGEILSFGLEKGMDCFYLRYANFSGYAEKYGEKNRALWKFREAEGSDVCFDSLVGRLDRESIGEFCRLEWKSPGFLLLSLYGKGHVKKIKSDDANELYLENFSMEEAMELERRLEKHKRK